jgi:hypothetical protein
VCTDHSRIFPVSTGVGLGLVSSHSDTLYNESVESKLEHASGASRCRDECLMTVACAEAARPGLPDSGDLGHIVGDLLRTILLAGRCLVELSEDGTQTGLPGDEDGTRSGLPGDTGFCGVASRLAGESLPGLRLITTQPGSDLRALSADGVRYTVPESGSETPGPETAAASFRHCLPSTEGILEAPVPWPGDSFDGVLEKTSQPAHCLAPSAEEAREKPGSFDGVLDKPRA